LRYIAPVLEKAEDHKLHDMLPLRILICNLPGGCTKTVTGIETDLMPILYLYIMLHPSALYSE